MKIGLHGGDCCGIKVIYQLGTAPSINIADRRARKQSSFSSGWHTGSLDMLHYNPKGRYCFFNEAAEKETCEQRFRRFVKFIVEKRPHGIIEVVLGGHQIKWLPILADLDFNKVSSGKNSNTGATITVYHLVY